MQSSQMRRREFITLLGSAAGRMAARGACATGGNAGGRVSAQRTGPRTCTNGQYFPGKSNARISECRTNSQSIPDGENRDNRTGLRLIDPCRKMELRRPIVLGLLGRWQIMIPRTPLRRVAARGLFAALLLAPLAAFDVHAQQITGTPGSPDATTTIPGNQLPPPAPKFGGVIRDDALRSKPWWPPRVVPPKGAPNILLIMTDDAGFGITSTFGGVIPTPSLDRIAANGLRYNRIFSTSLCSPTRAAIITGRNHHSVGFGVIAEQATGFPGYDSIIGLDNATIGRILRDNGYATSWFGK